MRTSETLAAIAPAIVAAHKAMKHPHKNASNPHLRNKFADLQSVIDTTRPVLAKHGLAVVQSPIWSEGRVGLSTCIMHESGEWIEDQIQIPLAERRGLNTEQAAGCILTYLRRYAWQAVCGVAAEPDDDGNEEKPTGTRTPATPANKEDQDALV